MSQEPFLVSGQQVAGGRESRKKEAAPLLSKGYRFGGGGQEFEIKYAEEKPVRGKTSSKTCPFSLSDGFPNEVCFSLPSPVPSPHLTRGFGEFNNSPSGTVLASLQIRLILGC